jgi:hypothetical protein
MTPESRITLSVPRRRTIKQYTLQETTVAILQCLHELRLAHPEPFAQLTKVLIELQPRFNNRMKLISHVIFGKMCEWASQSPHPILVRFVHASDKLRFNPVPSTSSPPSPQVLPPLPDIDSCPLKDPYARRKWLSQKRVHWLLATGIIPDTDDRRWQQFLFSLKQQHDACDTALFCISELSQAHKCTQNTDPGKQAPKCKKKNTKHDTFNGHSVNQL